MSKVAEPTIEELKAQVAALTESVNQAKRAQSGVDRSYVAEKKRADLLEARIAQGGSEAAILARLEGIVKGTADKERRLELRYFARVKCLDAGISYDLLADLELPDEMAIEKKVSQFSEAIDARTVAAVNGRLSMGQAPRAGNDSAPSLSPFEQLVAKEVKGVR